jgi:hypothetical protein
MFEYRISKANLCNMVCFKICTMLKTPTPYLNSNYNKVNNLYKNIRLSKKRL